MSINSLLRRNFQESFQKITQEIYKTANISGWWDEEPEIRTCVYNVRELNTLSELCEAFRENNPPDKRLPEFSIVEIELANNIIKEMDFGIRHGLRLAEAIIAKKEFNKNRPHEMFCLNSLP